MKCVAKARNNLDLVAFPHFPTLHDKTNITVLNKKKPPIAEMSFPAILTLSPWSLYRLLMIRQNATRDKFPACRGAASSGQKSSLTRD